MLKFWLSVQDLWNRMVYETCWLDGA